VPEVMSVLDTFSRQNFANQLGQIPFVGQLIGSEVGRSLTHFSNDTASAITSAIKDSDIEIIQRMKEPTRVRLGKHIAHVARNANLRGTQLRAFLAALTSSIHVTQGPPGTGKVYRQ
jgi:hypothetical protein